MGSGDALSKNGSRAATRWSAPPRVVAVTGACSLVGRNLVGILEEDERVSRIVLLDVGTPKTAGQKTRSYRVDLTQPAVGARLAEILHAEHADALMHLAFTSSPTSAEAWAHELESAGTMHVLNACREARVKKIVMQSTTALYGPHASNPNFLRETHPLRGIPGCAFLADKILAERDAERFAEEHADVCVTVLRLAPVLGPTARNWVTRWLSRRVVPTMLGFDPLVQFVHEMDAVTAFVMALERDVPGPLNIVGDGVLHVSTAVKLAARSALPLPGFLLKRAGAALWMAGLNEAPPSFVRFLRHLCVADGARAREKLGFVPAYTSHEAVLDFGGALRLREARLLTEAMG